MAATDYTILAGLFNLYFAKKTQRRDDFKQLIKAAHRLRNKREARRLKEIELHKQQPDTYTDDLPF